MRYCPSCHSVYPNDFRTCPKDQSELRVASELQPGMVLRGKYEILGKLGAGGMATVYRARHLAFAEVRAIKVVGNRLADDEDFLRRFRNEAVMARRLQHPNAVRVDDLDTTEDGRPFIVMEYVEGRNLREVVRREGALDVRRAVRIAGQVASALAAAHDLGIVHRDIKPDNILLQGVGESETAKVLDFGIAKIKEGALGDSDHVATRTGTVVGTPQYISPEQAMGRRGRDLDGRADLYSLGVVLYEMVTGRLPFESDTAMGIILHHLQTPPPPPNELRPDLGIPAPLSAVLMRALEKDRDKRFASAVEMRAALDEILALALPERPEASRVAEVPEDARPLTPRPVPPDIDRFETRDLPRTPPADGRRTPSPSGVGSAMPAPWTPPPLPTTSVSRATPPSVATPVPQPTILTSGPTGLGGGRHAASTPPPLPYRDGIDSPGRRRREKRPWWIWVAVAGMVFWFVDRQESRARRNREEKPQPAASEVDAGERDMQIRAEVERALKATPMTRRENIEVEVGEGVVTLSGKASPRVAKVAEVVARSVTGVRDVRSEIERPEQPEAAERTENPEVGDNPSGLPGFVHPSIPPFPRPRPIVPGVTPEDVEKMLQEARKAMKDDEPEKAVGVFGTVLGMDPMNEEARKGLRDATVQLGLRAQGRRGAPRPPPAPLPSPP